MARLDQLNCGFVIEAPLQSLELTLDSMDRLITVEEFAQLARISPPTRPVAGAARVQLPPRK